VKELFLEIALLNQILDQYHHFDDAVIEGISVQYERGSRLGNARIELLARKDSPGNDENWYRTTLLVF
jgi:hypothetical protein